MPINPKVLAEFKKLQKKSVFNEAAEYMRQKVPIPTKHWQDIPPQAHSRAFMVTGGMKEAMLKDFQGSIIKAIESGTGLKEFRKDFDKIVARHGWDYKGGRNWRSKVIFETNIGQAQAAGSWKQIQAGKKFRPYVRYVAVMDSRTRPRHQELHGVVRHVDDPFWDIYAPKNGWRCRCDLVSLSQVEMDMEGYKAEPMATEEDMERLKEKRIVKTVEGYKEAHGYKGISQGFEYNPGRAGFGNKVSEQVWLDKGKGWTSLTNGNYESFGRPKTLPQMSTKTIPVKAQETAKDVAAAIRHNLDEADLILTPVGEVYIDANWVAEHIDIRRSSYVSFIKEVLENPQEVWGRFMQSDATGKVVYRRTYVRTFETIKPNEVITMIIDGGNGQMSGWTFFKGRANTAAKNRTGKLLYSSENK